MHYQYPATTHQPSWLGQECQVLCYKASACHPLPSCCLTASSAPSAHHCLLRGRQQMVIMHMPQAHIIAMTMCGLPLQPTPNAPQAHQPLSQRCDSRWEQVCPASSPPLAGQHCLAPQPCASAPAGPEPPAAAAHTGRMLQGLWTPPVAGAAAGALAAAGPAAVAPRQGTLHDKAVVALRRRAQHQRLHMGWVSAHCTGALPVLDILLSHCSLRTSRGAGTSDHCLAA